MSEAMATTCPACGHRSESHPMEPDGSRTCSQVLNGLPSCEECAAPLRALNVRQTAKPCWDHLGAGLLDPIDQVLEVACDDDSTR